MITIKDLGNERAEIHIDKGTAYHVLLLGAEMLVETLTKDRDCKLEDVIDDIIYIYKRDNEKSDK